jgi:hypothetical protein
VAALTDDRAATRARLERAFLAARLFGFVTVGWVPEDAHAMVTDGLDTASADAILAALGQDEPFLEWVELRSASIQIDNAMLAIDDPELTEHYERYLATEIDSREEEIALSEVHLRIAELLVGPVLAEAAHLECEPGAETAFAARLRDC